jgi:hypothetical protein
VLKYRTGAEVLSDIGAIGGSGTAGQVAYWNGTSSQTGSNNLFWNSANSRLGIGTNSPLYNLHNVGTSAFDNGGSGDAMAILNNGYIVLGSTRFRAFGATFQFQDASFNTKVSFNTGGQVIFNTGGNVTIGTLTDGGQRLQVQGTTLLNGATTISGSTTASSAIARGGLLNTTLVASANNDVLVGLDVNPTFTNGAFTGVSNIALRVNGFLQASNFKTTISGNPNQSTTVIIGSGVGNNITQENNICIGGVNNGIGRTTAQSLTIGANNTIVGQGSASYITTGNQNSVLGSRALGGNSTTMSSNIALGDEALRNNTGSNNVSVGATSALNVTSGSGNLFLGDNAARFQANGSTNLALTGNNNIYIGQQVRGFNNTDTNAIVIGSVGIGLGSNTTVIGNSSTTDTAIYGRMLVNYSSPVIGTHALDVNGTARVREYLYMLRSDAATTVAALTFQSGGTIDIGTTFRVLSTNRWDNITSSSSYIQNGYTTKTFVTTNAANASFSSYDFSASNEYQPTIANLYTQKLINGAMTINSTAGTNNFHGISISTIDNSASISNNVYAVYADATLGTNASANRWAGYFVGRGYFSQALSIGTNSPSASAILQADSTTRGFLPPRMTNAQKNAISSPAAGLVVYDNTDNYLSLYNGTNWQNIVSPNSSGNVLIGTTADQGYRVQITSASADSQLNVWGAASPSIRLDNAASGATQRFVIGLATATNNFIQGANAGDVCMTPGTSSALVFGMWQTSSSSEVMRISTSSNVLIGKNTDSGQKLQVVGKVNLTSLPTSATGLMAGDVWNNGGVLNIV